MRISFLKRFLSRRFLSRRFLSRRFLSSRFLLRRFCFEKISFEMISFQKIFIMKISIKKISFKKISFERISYEKISISFEKKIISKFKKISFKEFARPEVSEQILDIWSSLLVCHYHLAATHQAFIFSLYYMPPSAHRQSILESITINISQRPQSFAKVTAKAIFRLQRWPFESGPKKYQNLTQHSGT